MSQITGEQFKHVAIQSMGKIIHWANESNKHIFHCLIQNFCHSRGTKCPALDEVTKHP